MAPVILVLALGFAAGKHHSFSADQARGLSRLALTYALPAALFLGMAHFDRALLLRQGPTVILGSLVALVVQPALFFIMIKVGGVSRAMARAAFVASPMPTGTPSVLFAQQYGSCEAEAASIMLVTTLGMLVALPASIALSAYL
jgi:malonate transporter and related proteins